MNDFDNVIYCHGCGQSLHMKDGIIPRIYGIAHYWVECAICGWIGYFVIDVKRLEQDHSARLIKQWEKWKRNESK